jgi:hypothetical protein
MTETITAQEILDTVVKHMMTQRRQATREGGACVYRTAQGLKCNVGALIPDDEYDPQMDDRDDTRVTSIHRAGLLPERLTLHIELLAALQAVHDSNTRAPDGDDDDGGYMFDFDKCRDALSMIAANHGLTFDAANFK